MLKTQYRFPRNQFKFGCLDLAFLVRTSINNLFKYRQRFIIVSDSEPRRWYLKTLFYLNKSVVKTESCVGSGCFYSLRSLKSARSTLNMSVIPSAERDSFRSNSASAVNLNTIKPLHSHLLVGFKSRLHVWAFTLGWAGGLFSCASVWTSSAPWLCWCAGWCGTGGCPPQKAGQSACWRSCRDKAAQSPYISDPGVWWPCLGEHRTTEVNGFKGSPWRKRWNLSHQFVRRWFIYLLLHQGSFFSSFFLSPQLEYFYSTI